MPQNVLNAVPIKLVVDDLDLLITTRGAEPCTYKVSKNSNCLIKLKTAVGNVNCTPNTGLTKSWFEKVWREKDKEIVLHLVFTNCKRNSFKGQILNNFLARFSSDAMLIGRYNISNEDNKNKKLIVAFK